MKLVNPVGRIVEEIQNQANYGCSCSIVQGTSNYNNAYNDLGWCDPGECSCGCAYGYDNASANWNRGYAR
nr:hypothetical protein [uncultured Lachnoclostridium sp.]